MFSHFPWSLSLSLSLFLFVHSLLCLRWRWEWFGFWMMVEYRARLLLFASLKSKDVRLRKKSRITLLSCLRCFLKWMLSMEVIGFVYLVLLHEEMLLLSLLLLYFPSFLFVVRLRWWKLESRKNAKISFLYRFALVLFLFFVFVIVLFSAMAMKSTTGVVCFFCTRTPTLMYSASLILFFNLLSSFLAICLIWKCAYLVEMFGDVVCSISVLDIVEFMKL